MTRQNNRSPSLLPYILKCFTLAFSGWSSLHDWRSLSLQLLLLFFFIFKWTKKEKKKLWFSVWLFEKAVTVSKQSRTFCYKWNKTFWVDTKCNELFSLYCLFSSARLQTQNFSPLKEAKHLFFPHLTATEVKGEKIWLSISIRAVNLSTYCRLKSVWSQCSQGVVQISLSSYFSSLIKDLLLWPSIGLHTVFAATAQTQFLQLQLKPCKWHLEIFIRRWPW